MKKTKTLLLLAVITAVLASCAPTSKLSAKKQGHVRNVILMIGDGMGLSHVYAAMTVSELPLNIERSTVTGLQKNYSSDNYVTDSGASGTAIATGTKTNNGAIGVDSKGNRVRSILEIAEANNRSTGLISTSSLTHATPASFIAHQSSRGSYENIAMDFIKTDVDVLIGGGYDHFANRADKLNLLDTLRARNYEVVNSLDKVLKSTSSKLAGLIAPVHNPYRLKGRGNMLPTSTGKAIEILNRNRVGFFLMVEGSQIDWAGHANAADTLIDETLDFDQAIGVALDFAEDDGHTLVIVTGDHETGGVTLLNGDLNSNSVSLHFSTTDHTGIMIPVYAFGPGAEKFSGIYENTDIFKKILEAFGFK